MAEKVLIIEDEVSLQETLEYNLKREGYQVAVNGNGSEGLSVAREWRPDLVLLDVMLPGMDGFEVCKALRKEMDIPILMLTARADEIDRVVGFEIGVDDYIIKPFSMRELMARVKTRLKSYHQLIAYRDNPIGSSLERNELVVGDLVVNFNRHEISMAGEILQLKPKEYDLLVYLLQHAGKVVTRETVLEKVWGWDYYGDSRTVDVHIRWLRSKIEKDPSNPRLIITVPGVGYRYDG